MNRMLVASFAILFYFNFIFSFFIVSRIVIIFILTLRANKRINYSF